MGVGGVVLTVIGTLAGVAIVFGIIGWLCGKLLDSHFFR